jgi:hypothetical protein
MSSRLAVDGHGRAVVVVTTPSPCLEVGMRFPVVDAIELNTWLTQPGRPPTAKEQAEARPPYVSPNPSRRAAKREDLDDELLDERAALEACIREQQREPADLIGRAA